MKSAHEGEDKNHDLVFIPATLKLGEIHWYLLRAAKLMRVRTTVERKVQDESGFAWTRSDQTDFGREVAWDEINWWVFKKETSINELRAQTQRTLDTAQVLKEASAALKTKKPTTYPELLNTIRDFAEHHIHQIESLYEYVCWLNARDVLAPTTLYNYRVWGSTRMSDRRAEIDGSKPEEDLATIRHLTEIVTGLSSDGFRTIEKAYMEVGAEIWEAYDGEEYRGEPKIPEARILRVACRMVYDECATYFMCIRDSLRNILLDIDKFVEQKNLVSSDRFWRTFVSKAITTLKTETALWDFKETLTMWRVGRGPERERAKITFCEDVASFANSRGGVLIIGVTDQRKIVGIADDSRDMEQRLQFASEVLDKHFEYNREIVRFHQLVITDRAGTEKLCLVVIVAQACETVGVNDGAGHYTYPVRHETGLKRGSKNDLDRIKLHLKSDSYDFLRDLSQFIDEN